VELEKVTGIPQPGSWGAAVFFHKDLPSSLPQGAAGCICQNYQQNPGEKAKH
jgi:hypothetical protein